MAEARGRWSWAQVSSVLSLVANVNRDPKKHRAFKPRDFNPYERRRTEGIPLTAANMHLLKKAFVKEHP